MTHNPGYLLEYRSDNRGALLTRAVRPGCFGGTGCGDHPSAMTVDLFALLCALAVTSSAMEGKWRGWDSAVGAPGMLAGLGVGQRCASGSGRRGCQARGSRRIAVVVPLVPEPAPQVVLQRNSTFD